MPEVVGGGGDKEKRQTTRIYLCHVKQGGAGGPVFSRPRTKLENNKKKTPPHMSVTTVKWPSWQTRASFSMPTRSRPSPTTLDSVAGGYMLRAVCLYNIQTNRHTCHGVLEVRAIGDVNKLARAERGCALRGEVDSVNVEHLRFDVTADTGVHPAAEDIVRCVKIIKTFWHVRPEEKVPAN